ncbi:MAG: tetratricopeptide repeat protein, partial [Deltaproteobacteria bacterium]|nr:tetratricopeptide repeat protein [Deltaproteobacteria bacterium]
QIKKVLSSELLVQGLAGNILLDGKYLPKDIAKTIRAFKHFKITGDDHFAKQDWQQAAANYSQALTIAAQKEGVEEQLIFDVTETMKTAEFNVLLRAGTEFIDRKKWVLATQELDKALELVKQLNIENKAELIDTISKKLAEISLATSKEQGDLEFAEGNWQKALTHYKEALASVRRSYKPGDPTLEELKQLIVKAELYDTVNNGKEAFTRSEWDEAISSYEQAIVLLESNQDILKQTNTEENRKKLARVMLQASVIRDKQSAARHLKEKQYLTAIEKLQSILSTISDSDFRDELEFKAVIKDTKTEIKNTETDMLLADKIAYLEENFKKLFTQHYTASSPESLTEPAVEFDKRVGDKLIFKLVCIEVGRGRPLRLVMKYIHDLKDGSWRFYSGND